MSAVSHSIAPTEPAQTAQGHSGTPQPISGPQNGAERDELAAALVRQICISTELRRERDEARAAVSRLNRRVQVAESAILRRLALTGAGQESHGLLCATTSRARGTAVALEAENARLTEALYLTRITLEATFRVLQEASGLPDDIDDPDCRDEMVLALRPRAEKAEAENARLVDRIERLSAEYEADLPESMAGDERLRRVFDDHANDVLGLLSDEDEGGE